MIIKCNNIYTPTGIKKGFLTIENGILKNISESLLDSESTYIDYSDKNIFPGFIDIHIHGYGRGSFAYKGDSDSIKNMSKDVVQMGVTSYLLTSGTMPKKFLESSYNEAKKIIESFVKGEGAEPIGIHMEGPFINEKYIGMQRLDSVERASIEKFKYYNKISGNNIKLVTLAPEIEGAIDLIKYLDKNNIVISAGHTAATFDEVKVAIDAGLTNFTHVYSGMRGFHHRELGVVGAAMFFKNTYVELAKQSGITIKSEAFDIMYRLKGDEKLVMMTDCLGLGGFPEGYSFYYYLRKTNFTMEKKLLKLEMDNGDISYISTDDFEKLKDLELGFLESIKNIVDRLENKWLSVMKIACENPAKIAGVFNRKGSIEAGKDADFLILDQEWNLSEVYCFGKKQI